MNKTRGESVNTSKLKYLIVPLLGVVFLLATFAQTGPTVQVGQTKVPIYSPALATSLTVAQVSGTSSTFTVYAVTGQVISNQSAGATYTFTAPPGQTFPQGAAIGFLSIPSGYGGFAVTAGGAAGTCGDATHSCQLTITPSGSIVKRGNVSISAGNVSSVFTRTGAVVATTGDYTCAEVTNCGTGTIGGSIASTQVPVGTGTNTVGGSASLTADSNGLHSAYGATTFAPAFDANNGQDNCYGFGGLAGTGPEICGISGFLVFAYDGSAVGYYTPGNDTWTFGNAALTAGAIGAVFSTTSPLYATTTNCIANGTAASPSVAACGVAAAGMFSCATNASTATCQVNTTAVTANSEIQITQNTADGGASQLNVTCNTGLDLSATKPILASKSAGASFTINLGTVTANPACFEFSIIN